MIWPSELAVRGAEGLQPVGVPYPGPEPGSCRMCGRPLAAGDPYVKKILVGRRGFTNHVNVTDPSSLDGCGWCAAVMEPIVLRRGAGAVYTTNGAFPLLKDVHRAWLFLTPPAPPFLTVIAMSKNQHLVWRATVTRDPELMQVQAGDHSLRIRRRYLLAAVDVARRTATAFIDWQRARGRKKPKSPPHPYLSLDRNLESTLHGRLRPDYLEAANEVSSIAEGLDFLTDATQGELWAMATLCKTNTPAPEHPEPLVFS